MRNMSFSLTTAQVLAGTKTVTRRIGWAFLKPGDRVQAVEKGMGLKKGEKVRRLAVLRVVDVRRERLDAMLEPRYGVLEVRAEGFGEDPRLRWPSEFVEFFASTHRCRPTDLVTRIEFAYEPRGEGAGGVA